MRYLVTGGAGFIGSNLCRKLLREGHRVACLDDLSTGKYSNIEKLELKSGFEFFKHDLTKPFFPDKIPISAASPREILPSTQGAIFPCWTGLCSVVSSAHDSPRLVSLLGPAFPPPCRRPPNRRTNSHAQGRRFPPVHLPSLTS